MKLIMEGASVLTGHYEDELNEASGSTERNYYISGIFSTPEAKNRNGRVYSRNIWEREVQRYQKEINERSANTLGEWQHPPRSTIDPLKAVLRIVELKIDSSGNVVGKAKILNDNTEQTNKLKGLIKEGIKIGVSSRGVGKVSSSGVVEEFKLITYDAVDIPSDYNAMLDGVVEGYLFENGIMQDKEFQIDENGCIGEVCNIDINTEKPDEKCLVKEKIEEAIGEAKEDIFDQISDYLKESLDKIDNDRTMLIESISDFLDEENIDIYEEQNKIEESKIDSLIKSLKSISESKEEKEEIFTCSECGREVEKEEEKCSQCLSKEEIENEKESLKEQYKKMADFTSMVVDFNEFKEAYKNTDTSIVEKFKIFFI